MLHVRAQQSMRSTSGFDKPLIVVSKRIPARLFLAKSEGTASIVELLEKKLIDGLVVCNTSPLSLKKKLELGLCVCTVPHLESLIPIVPMDQSSPLTVNSAGG